MEFTARMAANSVILASKLFVNRSFRTYLIPKGRGNMPDYKNKREPSRISGSMNGGQNGKLPAKSAPVNPMEKWLAAFPPPSAAAREQEKPDDAADKKDILFFKNKTAGKSRRKFPDRIDLHGFTKEDAARHLRDFIRNSIRGGLRKILVIHGRGLNSPGEAVLPALVRSELETNPHVLDFGTAPPSEGGEGAMRVFLRQDKRWIR
jgi:DNA-nicking Smr family endonuclease